jgi:MFS family permease
VLAIRLPGGGRPEVRGLRVLRVPRTMLGVVAQGALGVAAAFGVGGVVLALGADVAVDLLGTSDPLVVGLVLALSAATIGVTALLARRVRASRGAPAGAAIMLVGLALLVLAATTGSLPAFLVSTVVTGVGYSLLFAAGIGVAATLAPAEHRAATVSAVYFVGYGVQAAAAIAIGRLATDDGLVTGIVVGAVVLGLLAVAAGAAPFVRARRAVRPTVSEGNPA